MAKIYDERTLQRAAHHVAHDIRMLREAWRRQGDPLAYTAWFVHCRSVMEFFSRTCGADSRAICAWHYVGDESTWRAVLDMVDAPKEWKTYKDAVGPLAGHLSVQRLHYEGKELRPSTAITEYLMALTVVFLRKLPEERLAWFGAYEMF